MDNYRIDLIHFIEGSGYTHSETIDNVENTDFDLMEYLKEYFWNEIIKEDEWYDCKVIDNNTNEIIKEEFNLDIDWWKNIFK